MITNEWQLLETGRREKDPVIAFTKAKNVRFNGAFMRKYNLISKKSVQILTQERENHIFVGFRFLDRKEERALRLNIDEKSQSGFCSGTSLMNFLKINPRELETNKFQPIIQEYNGEKIFTINFTKKKLKNLNDPFG